MPSSIYQSIQTKRVKGPEHKTKQSNKDTEGNRKYNYMYVEGGGQRYRQRSMEHCSGFFFTVQRTLNTSFARHDVYTHIDTDLDMMLIWF